MKNTNSKGEKQNSGCGCHHHGGKHLFMGLVLIVIGASFKYGYDMTDVLMLVGALFMVKGLHVMSMKKKCND